MLNYLSITHLIDIMLKLFGAIGLSRSKRKAASANPDAPKRMPRALL
jgi:hypothetical protein